jgi:hypothetical protein
MGCDRMLKKGKSVTTEEDATHKLFLFYIVVVVYTTSCDYGYKHSFSIRGRLCISGMNYQQLMGCGTGLVSTVLRCWIVT